MFAWFANDGDGRGDILSIDLTPDHKCVIMVFVDEGSPDAPGLLFTCCEEDPCNLVPGCCKHIRKGVSSYAETILSPEHRTETSTSVGTE